MNETVHFRFDSTPDFIHGEECNMQLSINRRKSSWLSSCLNLEERVRVWTRESENDSLLGKYRLG